MTPPDTLPGFRYHPDPIASGSVIESDTECRCCERARGFVYSGPVYSEEDVGDELCPWCIADGSAHERFDATFVDSEAFAEDVPDAAFDEITERTPGFDTWQSEVWPVCCGDATAFVAPEGAAELRESGLEGAAMSHIVYELGLSGSAATRLLDSLNRDTGPTADVFRCLTCGQARLHVDMP